VTGSSAPAVVKLLRRAGAVTVYESVTASGLRVVVKQLDPAIAQGDRLGERRFRREFKLATMLRHPCLPQVIATGDNWLAFEHLGSSLAEPAVARLRSAPAEIRALMRQVAAALAYIHARGIVHGDIKPAHLMFRGDVPVLIDFGIAGLTFDDPLADIEFAGTPSWMAPELVYGSKPGPEADIWSMSAHCLWLLTGTRPFTGDADEVLARRRQGARPDFVLSSEAAQRDPVLLALLQSGLGPPDARPSSASIVNFLPVRQ
jgi:serine/threonine-protein kinase